jgi:hypothetical protein
MSCRGCACRRGVRNRAKVGSQSGRHSARVFTREAVRPDPHEPPHPLPARRLHAAPKGLMALWPYEAHRPRPFAPSLPWATRRARQPHPRTPALPPTDHYAPAAHCPLRSPLQPRPAAGSRALLRSPLPHRRAAAAQRCRPRLSAPPCPPRHPPRPHKKPLSTRRCRASAGRG